QVPLYFAGARLVTFFGGAGLGDGMGLLHGVSSYVGQLILSVVSDRDMMPDPGHYADLLDQSFAALADATVGRPTADAKSAAGRGFGGAPSAPGLLALREGSMLAAAVEALEARPDVLLVDATGRDHPRRAGLALHLGAVLDVPTIGVTHRPLRATGPEPGPR